MNQQQKAELFRSLHNGDKLLVLPNCWDSISAKVLQGAGARAIATASASISWAQGVSDGEGLSLETMVGVVKLACDAVDIPVTADMERGFGETPDNVEKSIAAVIAVGAVGVNIEDNVVGGSQREIKDMQERISAARRAGDQAAVNIYINARADGYLLGLTGQSVFDDTVARGKAWLEAGADCVFVPGVADIEIIANLVTAIGGPVSVIVMDEKTPTLEQLSGAGVTRISTGPRPMQAVMGSLANAVLSINEHGDFRFMRGAPGFGDLQKL